MKKLSGVVMVLVLLVVTMVFGGAVWWRVVTGAPSTSTEQQSFLITKGSGAERVGKNLKELGLIRSSLAFKIYLQVNGLTKKVPPGEFVLAANLSLRELVDTLLNGPTELWVTVPEGLRREEIVEKYIDGLGLVGEEAVEFRAEFLAESAGMEGYLFPDTYLFPREVEAARVVVAMRATFDKKFPGASESDVILASILERETITDGERPVVAGIFWKRLANEWTLDADATLQYPVGKPGDWWPRPVTQAMKDSASLYNTYRYGGLPPGPICNPGLSSLEAAANPEESEYWFYIHDNDGKIRYAETLEGHNRNVQKYLR